MLNLHQILVRKAIWVWSAAVDFVYGLWDGMGRWFARCLPLWLVPNHITVGGIVVGVMVTCLLAAYAAYAEQGVRLPGLLIAILVLSVITFLSDMLDGALARERKLESEIGGMLDALRDKIATMPILVYVVCREAATNAPTVVWWLIAFIGFEFIHAVAGLWVFSEKLKGRIHISQRPNLPGRIKMLAVSTASIAAFLALIAPVVPFVPIARWMASLSGLLLPCLVVATLLAPLSLLLHVVVKTRPEPIRVITPTAPPSEETERPASSA